ncbi:uncharacterized protein [Euwallacea fornicatus]|uniref:uncharacterized protein n=1 Tax=Euwallacea fornicatus TaxID=995702 RepID=UPI003390181D
MAEEALGTCPQLHVKLVRCDNLIAQNLASKLRVITQELKQNQPRYNKVKKHGAHTKNVQKENQHTTSIHDMNLKEEVSESDIQDQALINNQGNSRLTPSIEIKAEPSIIPLKPNSKFTQASLCNSSKPAAKKKQIPPYVNSSKAGRFLSSSANHAAGTLCGKLLNFKLRTNTKLQQTLVELLHLKRDYNSINNTMVQDEVKAMRWKHSLALYGEPEDSIMMVDSDSNTSDDMWKYVICKDTESYVNSRPVMKLSWKVIESEELSKEVEVAKGSPKTVLESKTSSKLKAPSVEITNTDDNGSSTVTYSEIEPVSPTSESSTRNLLSIDGITIEVDPVFPECPLCAEISESLEQLKTHIESFHEKKVTSVASDNNSSQVSLLKETFFKQNPKINQYSKSCNKGINNKNIDNQSQHKALKKNFNALHQLTHYVNVYTNNKKSLLQGSSFNWDNIPNTLGIGRTPKVRKKETEVIVLDSDSD